MIRNALAAQLPKIIMIYKKRREKNIDIPYFSMLSNSFNISFLVVPICKW
jgi:hypothetical protein